VWLSEHPITLAIMANKTTRLAIGSRKISPGTARKKVPTNTQAAATDMMIGALVRKLSTPIIGKLVS
jgi:hypothetical protein